MSPGKTYLLAARGHFTLYHASWPPGGGPPKGTRMFFNVEARHPKNGFSDGGLLGARDHPERCGPWVQLF